MHRGYIKFWRKMLDNPLLRKPKVLTLWVTLLLLANHKERDELFGGKRITCKAGQFTTGRKKLADETGLNESFIERTLKLLENEQQIEQQKSNTNRLITIINWNKYQQNEQQIEQQVNNDRTTSEQRVNTPKECKNIKNDKNIYIYEFWEYFLTKTQKKFKLTKDKKELIKKRLNDGFSVDDLKTAVDNFVNDDWEGRSAHLDLIYCIGKQRGKPDALEKWLNYTKKGKIDGKRYGLDGI